LHLLVVVTMPFFRKTDTEILRDSRRVLRHAECDLKRDRRHLAREEHLLQEQIKQAAACKDQALLQVLCKQLVKLREQNARSCQLSAKLSGINSDTRLIVSNANVASSMKTAAKTMHKVNDRLRPLKMAKSVQKFDATSAKMEMTEEMISDALDNVLAESDDESQEALILNQVLDELGIETAAKLPAVYNDRKAACTSTVKRNQRSEYGKLQK
ncbi:Charged multivesicular body protein 2b, partial [Trichinella nativa]